MVKRLLLVFLLGVAGALRAQTITIMIDPGHGGSDPGHLSANKNLLKEKDLNLLIAKKFGSYLTEKLANVKVVYTRTDDTYPSLDSRVEMANNQKVDYFISVHCNSSSSTSIKGTESHVHSMSSTKAVRLANIFETEFKTKAGRTSRGVKDSDDREHTLQVLKFTQMTSVLVECGFLTNVSEANFLNTTNGQDLIASALFRGMRTYLKEMHPGIKFEKSAGTSVAASTSAAKNTTTTYTVQIMSSKEWMDTEKSPFTKLSKAVSRQQVSQTGYKYKYTSGVFTSMSEAEAYQKEVRSKGFSDAIVVKT